MGVVFWPSEWGKSSGNLEDEDRKECKQRLRDTEIKNIVQS